MHLTPPQERFFENVKALIVGLGGMETKFSVYPLTIATKAGALRIRPAFDGIECQFDRPDMALAMFPNFNFHRHKGTFKVEVALGGDSDADFSTVTETFKVMVKPLLTS